MVMKPKQALLNKAPSKEQREKTQVPAGSVKPEGGSQRGKGTHYYVPESPGVLRSKLEEERKGKPESTVNLEEPSPATTARLKTEAAVYALCKATDTLNL
jgi:hypothetical protein